MVPNISTISVYASASASKPSTDPKPGKVESLTSDVIPSQQKDVPVDQRQPTQSELADAVTSLNNHVLNYRSDLHFSVDTDSGTVVVKVVDTQTEEVIRQMPSEEALAMARGLKETGSLLLNTKA